MFNFRVSFPDSLKHESKLLRVSHEISGEQEKSHKASLIKGKVSCLQRLLHLK